MQTVAIVGVGLIGGSFALGLKKAGFTGAIVGVSSPRALERGLARRAIDEASPLEAAIRRADLVYLAQPIARILETLTLIDPWLRPEALVTDAGSTKSHIVDQARRAIRRAQFLGGHPMAGKESRGVESADADLFSGRTYLLTPSASTELDTPGAQDFLSWIGRIGARPLIVSAEEHDRLVAFTSHLPQLASTALAAVTAGQLRNRADCLAAGPGLADTTRLALSSYDIWRDILATNSERISTALAEYIRLLERLRNQLDSPQVEQIFQSAADFRRLLDRQSSE